MASRIVPSRPSILMGEAHASSVRERTVHEQVEAYLSRIRHTLPLPCTPEECYFGCVPPTVKQWHDERLFEREAPAPGKESNLLSTMYATPTGQTTSRVNRTRPNILHISVEDEEDYLAAVSGHRGHQGVFWFEAPAHVPLPRNSMQTPFYLPSDHPKYDKIKAWVETAFEIEDEMQTSLECIDQFSALAKTDFQVRHAWPELLNFVTISKSIGATPRYSAKQTDELRQKIEQLWMHYDRESVITQLARAVMLPEKENLPLDAWVKFYTQEIAR